MKIIGSIIIFSLFISSCSNQERNENLADYKLAKEFGIDSASLKYQYFQKYGFTETCEDIHMIYIPKSSSDFINNLPIKKADLQVLKPKFIRITDSTIAINRNSRFINVDIELGYSEYLPDTNLNFRIKNGKYEISESEFSTTLRIFDEESGLVYVGIKQCDGR
jgi:hypothetical protein